MAEMGLNAVDYECIEFLAQRRNVPESVVQLHYAAAKKKFQFASGAYRQRAQELYALFLPVYGQEHEADIIAAHQFHAALQLYRHIGYSYYKQEKFDRWAERLDKLCPASGAVLLDYGCGLAYSALALAERRRDSQIVLVDIDGLVLDFAAWRFSRRGLQYEVIRVTAENPYPTLPEHDICIASGVMEHLLEPMRAYANITAGLRPGGALVGMFPNHGAELFHVSPRLNEIRAAVERDFVPGPLESIHIRRGSGPAADPGSIANEGSV